MLFRAISQRTISGVSGRGSVEQGVDPVAKEGLSVWALTLSRERRPHPQVVLAGLVDGERHAWNPAGAAD